MQAKDLSLSIQSYGGNPSVVSKRFEKYLKTGPRREFARTHFRQEISG